MVYEINLHITGQHSIPNLYPKQPQRPIFFIGRDTATLLASRVETSGVQAKRVGLADLEF